MKPDVKLNKLRETSKKAPKILNKELDKPNKILRKVLNKPHKILSKVLNKLKEMLTKKSSKARNKQAICMKILSKKSPKDGKI